MEACPVISLSQVAKRYLIYSKPQDRLKQMIWRGRRDFGRAFWALRQTSFRIHAGEVVGIVGRNGAGKSTLLQLVCGTLTPSQGTIKVEGTVAALLELGAGFNPEFTGRENVYMNGAILGMSREKIDARFDDILAFADIGDVIDQPVKTYSSGMYVRLAFAVAVNVDPEILIIDEALSVGDGVFARKSFDRIMAMKDAGKTILFCSHSTYHIESICTRAIWLHKGEVRLDGPASQVVSAYNDFLGQEMHGGAERVVEEVAKEIAPAVVVPEPVYQAGQGRLLDIRGAAAGRVGKRLQFHCMRDDFSLLVDFLIDPALPKPSVIMSVYSVSGCLVCSAGTHNDDYVVSTSPDGQGHVELCFPKMPLLKGEYFVNVFLACERGLHFYDSALYALELEVTQDGLEQGVVTLPHVWSSAAGNR
jgi:lipopolysaccharide transport system ATP-binding protein